MWAPHRTLRCSSLARRGQGSECPILILNQATEAFLEAAARHPRGSSRPFGTAPLEGGLAPLPLRAIPGLPLRAF